MTQSFGYTDIRKRVGHGTLRNSEIVCWNEGGERHAILADNTHLSSGTIFGDILFMVSLTDESLGYDIRADYKRPRIRRSVSVHDTDLTDWGYYPLLDPSIVVSLSPEGRDVRVEPLHYDRRYHGPIFLGKATHTPMHEAITELLAARDYRVIKSVDDLRSIES